jgi:serine/threonine-protein kinase
MAEVQTLLHDRYEIRSLLDVLEGRQVAVKILAAPFDRDRAVAERFCEEARGAARLEHPNIVSVLDVGSQDGLHFLVMEHVQGRTLTEVLAEEGPLPPERVAEIGAEVALALGAAHTHGVIHGDLTPGNVMQIGGAGVKVSDFAIARAADARSAARSGFIMGTARYLAPERARGPADPRSDVYSLGCVLHELVTGRPPFSAESAVGTLFQHVYEPLTPPSRIRSMPAGLEAIILRCLAKDPEQRYADASGLSADLRRSWSSPVPPAPPRRGSRASTTGPRTQIEGARRSKRRLRRPRDGAGPGPGGPTSAAGPHRPRRPALAPVLALVAAAAAIVVIIGGMGLGTVHWSALPPSSVSPVDGSGATAGPTSAAAGAGAPPITEPTPAVPDAYSSFVDTIGMGRGAGMIDGRGSTALIQGARDAYSAYQQGRVRTALTRMADLNALRRSLLSQGHITEAAASSVQRAITTLTQAMRSAAMSSPAAGGPG